jgi:hypothetical protein
MLSCEEEDTCLGGESLMISMLYEEEDTCVSDEEDDACLGSESLMISMNLELPVSEREVRVSSRYCLVYL